MTDTAGPILEADLDVAVDYGQLFIYSPEVYQAASEQTENVYLDALAEATDSRRYVGAALGVVDMITPGQWNFHTPVRVEVWNVEPPAEDGWDHEVDIDLDVPDGELYLEGPTCSAETVTVPIDRYRMRVSGRGFTALGGSGADGDDTYRVRLWPRTTDSAPELRRSWPGWTGR